MKQRKLERLILDLEDFRAEVSDVETCDKLETAIKKLKEVQIWDEDDP